VGRPTRENQHRRRALLRLSLTAVLAVSLATMAWAALAGLTRAAAVSGLIATFAALATLAFEITMRLWAPREPLPSAGDLADDLAHTVEDQWLEEAHARRLRDPGVLPLTWSATNRPVTDDPAAVVGSPATGTVRLRLRGQIDGELDDATDHIATEYRKIPSGRLVVLGEPGAGKSVLAILLTLGLLRSRASGAAVPVLLSAASWDPTASDLDAWIVETVAKSYYQGQSEVPRRLLRHGLILPIIDGLDEILESARRTAVEHVNRATGANRPVVVTCRAREYEDLVTDGAPVLRRAPTVEVAPVAAGDLIDYFAGVDWPPGTDWTPVFAELRDDPTAPVSAALTTPLMISFARIVYQRLGGAPALLLDRDRFAGRHSVEDYLADKVVDAAYAPSFGPGGPDQPMWNAADARRWLTFLATYLHRNHERDLVWWTLSHRLLSRWWAPAVGAVSGVGVLIAISAWIAVFDPGGDVGLYSTLWYGSMIATAFGGVVTVMWYAADGHPPGRLSFTSHGTSARLRSGFRIGLAAVAIPAGPVLASMAAAISFGTGWSTYLADMFAEFAGAAIAVALCVGAALAVHSWLEAPPVYSASAGPQEQVRQDRALSWWGTLAVATVVGLLVLPAAAIGSGIGSLLVQASTDWSGWPGYPALPALFTARFRDLTDLRFPNVAITVGVAMVLPGVLVGLTLLLTRAWPRFVVARTWLAARGHLPLRLLAFLADARQREILRQRGGVYQFRHVRLQEQLATRHAIRSEGVVQVASAGRRGNRTAVALVACVLVATATVGLAVAPADTSMVRFATDYGAGPATLIFDEASTRLAAFTDTGSAVHVYDVAARRKVTSLPGNAGGIAWVEFAPGGRVVAVAAGAKTPETSDDAVRLWSLEIQAPALAATLMPAPTDRTHVFFNSTGDAALTRTYDSDGRIINGWLWFGGRVRTFSRAAGFVDLDFSPDLTSVLTRNNKSLAELWTATAPDRPPLDTWEVSEEGMASWYSADGQKLLVRRDIGKSYEIWLHDTQRLNGGQRLDCEEAQFVGTHHYLLCRRDKYLEVRDTHGTVVEKISGQLLEEGSGVLVIASDTQEGHIELWDADHATKLADLPRIYDTQFDKFSIDDDLPIVAVRHASRPSLGNWFELRDSRTGTLLAELSGNFVSADSQYSATNLMLRIPTDPDRLFVWNRWLRQPTELENFSVNTSPIFGPGDYLVADEGLDGRIRVRDLSSGRTLMTTDRPPWPLKDDVVFSSDMQSFFTYRTYDSIELRSRCTLSQTSIGNLSKTAFNATFSTYGRLLATAGTDGTVRLWDAANGRHLRTLAGHGGQVFDVVFTGDDATLVTSADDNTIRIWDLSGLPEQYRTRATGPC
jgi:WD40 repeat protein